MAPTPPLGFPDPRASQIVGVQGANGAASPPPPSWPPSETTRDEVRAMKRKAVNMSKWKTAAQVAGKATTSYNTARGHLRRAAGRTGDAKGKSIHGTLLIAKKSMFGSTKFVPRFIKLDRAVLCIWKSKREAVHSMNPRKRVNLDRCFLIPSDFYSRFAAAAKVWRQVSCIPNRRAKRVRRRGVDHDVGM